MPGAFLIQRDLLDHPALDDRRDQKWCRRAVFVDMVALAAYAPHVVDANGKTLRLNRGQFCHSTRFLAARWDWSESGVRRFFERLIEDGLIDATTDAGQTLVTIRKYDDMQRFANASDAPNDAEATQERRTIDAKKNEGNEKNEVNDRPSDPKMLREKMARMLGPFGFSQESRLTEADLLIEAKISEADLRTMLSRIAHAKKLDKKPARDAYERARDELLEERQPTYTAADRTWIARFNVWQASGHWKSEWGPKPGEHDCQMPEKAATTSIPYNPYSVGGDQTLDRIAAFNRCKTWLKDWGPRPDDPAFKVPTQLLNAVALVTATTNPTN